MKIYIEINCDKNGVFKKYMCDDISECLIEYKE